MTLEDLRTIPTLQTAAIAEACKDAETKAYIIDCLMRFYAGDWGEICAEDVGYNKDDLQAGCGHILARYKGKGKLQGDFYIESHFDTELPGIDANNTLIMYPSER